MRRQFGRAQTFAVRNLGDQPVFFEFLGSNPASQRSYRAAIRGAAIGDDRCACPDFTTNDLGTCKHIEFVLGRLERNRTAVKLLRRCHDDALAFIARARDAERRRRVVDAAYPRGARGPGLRTLVKAELYPYQAEGVLFAAGPGGACSPTRWGSARPCGPSPPPKSSWAGPA